MLIYHICCKLVNVFILLESHEKYVFKTPVHLFKYCQARYWPRNRVQDIQSYETDYDHSSLHYQSFVLSNLKADTEYVLVVAVKTTGGESGRSLTEQFKTTEGVR